MLVGYMRVSSTDERQSVDLQRDALIAAGVDDRHLHVDKASGARDNRPGLKACLADLRRGDCLVVWGAVVTVDAMGCQREIAQTIIDKKADYILALKGNQGTLRDDVELFVREQKAVAFKDTSVSRDTTVDGDHGRIETRTVTVFHDIGWLQDNHQWPGLKSVVMIESERETDGKVEAETRFYITSLALLANALGPMIRSHWMVENGLHWVLDMIFRDDECRVRTDNAPFNLAIVKHSALNVLRTRKSKDSLRMRAKSPHGTKTPSPPTSPHKTFSRFP